ncbi:hypothetical protein HaLaN_16141 [Haematococcus lacustris]|uniref:F-box domain-containing protein n=1 Tax=Haematococcus lacustris TaxID=44745 RepID=A0A699Z991_HAELA|nr:hypothetical protein HaLaN_16141 [Haematococcus lacustris]
MDTRSCALGSLMEKSSEGEVITGQQLQGLQGLPANLLDAILCQLDASSRLQIFKTSKLLGTALLRSLTFREASISIGHLATAINHPLLLPQLRHLDLVDADITHEGDLGILHTLVVDELVVGQEQLDALLDLTQITRLELHELVEDMKGFSLGDEVGEVMLAAAELNLCERNKAGLVLNGNLCLSQATVDLLTEQYLSHSRRTAQQPLQPTCIMMACKSVWVG